MATIDLREWLMYSNFYWMIRNMEIINEIQSKMSHIEHFRYDFSRQLLSGKTFKTQTKVKIKESWPIWRIRLKCTFKRIYVFAKNCDYFIRFLVDQKKNKGEVLLRNEQFQARLTFIDYFPILCFSFYFISCFFHSLLISISVTLSLSIDFY